MLGSCAGLSWCIHDPPPSCFLLQETYQCAQVYASCWYPYPRWTCPVGILCMGAEPRMKGGMGVFILWISSLNGCLGCLSPWVEDSVHPRCLPSTLSFPRSLSAGPRLVMTPSSLLSLLTPTPEEAPVWATYPHNPSLPSVFHQNLNQHNKNINTFMY